MSQLYCFFTKGDSMSFEVSDFLLLSAHDLMRSKRRKKRLTLKSINLTGEITTDYKIGILNGITGIQFDAIVDSEEGSVKVSFIVRPLKDLTELRGREWCRTPYSWSKEANPASN